MDKVEIVKPEPTGLSYVVKLAASYSPVISKIVSKISPPKSGEKLQESTDNDETDTLQVENMIKIIPLSPVTSNYDDSETGKVALRFFLLSCINVCKLEYILDIFQLYILKKIN